MKKCIHITFLDPTEFPDEEKEVIFDPSKAAKKYKSKKSSNNDGDSDIYDFTLDEDDSGNSVWKSVKVSSKESTSQSAWEKVMGLKKNGNLSTVFFSVLIILLFFYFASYVENMFQK